MFTQLSDLGYGLIVFAIIIGVGSVVLFNFGGAVAGCSSVTNNTAWTWNRTSGDCWNGTDSATPTGAAYTNTNYLNTQLGQSGLAGWTPAIIAMSVGLLFLGAFLIRNSKKGRY
jgi:hypothetical protein